MNKSRSPREEAALAALNQLDKALYEKAAELAELDFEFFRQVSECVVSECVVSECVVSECVSE